MSDRIEACCVEEDEIDVQEAQHGVQDADAILFKLSSMRQNCFEGQKVLRGKRTLKDTRVESGEAQSGQVVEVRYGRRLLCQFP